MPDAETAETLDEQRDGRRPSLAWLSFWYLILTLLLLWASQDAASHVVFCTISYSEFESHLTQGEVSECSVEQDAIAGKITPRDRAAPPPAGMLAQAQSGPFPFRSIRIGGPKLAAELGASKVEFSGVNSGHFSQLLCVWLLSIGIPPPRLCMQAGRTSSSTAAMDR